MFSQLFLLRKRSKNRYFTFGTFYDRSRRFPGPSEHSRPRVFFPLCPPPPPPPPLAGLGQVWNKLLSPCYKVDDGNRLATSCSNKTNTGHRRTGRGAGGEAAPPKRLQSRKVGQMLNISRAKSGKLKSQKAKSPQFVGQTKAVGQYSLHSRAILAYYKRNWDKLCQFCG
jgi:hypothetical protein